MIRTVFCSLFLLGLNASAWAGPKTPVDADDARPVGGRALPALQLKERTMMGPTLDMVDMESAEYLPVVMRASKALDMEPAYAQGIREGLDFVYKRNYKGARKHFAELDEQFP